MRSARVLWAVAGALLAGGALAGPAPTQAQLRYQQERAACLDGTSNQDRATCLKEAGAALQESRKGRLDDAAVARQEENRLARCDALRDQDRKDCILRMQEGTASGSALQGGILREHQQTVPSR